METDIGARPHEVLSLRIKDVEFIEGDGGRYARIVLNGKTGQRLVPLIDSISSKLREFLILAYWILNCMIG
jgi:integrase